MQKLSASTLLAIILLLVSHGEAQDISPLTREQSASIDREISSVYKADIPGAAVIIVRNGKPIFRRGYGLANVELSVPVRAEMVFRLASVTKQFTAVAIMMLVEQHKLELSDDIRKFLPSYPTGGQKITIENLLTHTSGIDDYINKVWPDRMREDMSPESLVDLFKNEPLTSPPGTKEAYSNSNYILLGMLVEKLSGEKYGQFVADHIFKPFGMTHTTYEQIQVIVPGHVTGYVFNGTTYLDSAYLSMSQLFAAGGIISSVDDLAAWNAAIDSGKLLTPNSRNRLFRQFRLANGDSSEYAYGWVISKFLEEDVASHAGGMPGFRSYVFRMPAKHLYIALLSNNESTDIQPEYIVHRIAAIALGKPLPEEKIVAINASSLAQYLGEYKDDQGETFTITQEGGTLYGQATGDPRVEMFGVGNDTFVIKAFDARITFFRADKKVVTGFRLIAGGQSGEYKKVK